MESLLLGLLCENKILEYSALVIGVRGENFMKQKIKYSNAPDEIREAFVNPIEMEDFLPPPELLILKEETTKVTIALSIKSIDFFKTVSKATHVPYQQMIRKVLDSYTDHYAK